MKGVPPKPPKPKMIKNTVFKTYKRILTPPKQQSAWYDSWGTAKIKGTNWCQS